MTKTMSKTEALAEHIGGVESSDLTKENFDHYGLDVYSVNGEEWAIGTDSECDDACKLYITDTAWAFMPSFICEYCDLPQELAEALEAMQSKKCEGANDSILALIEKTDGGLDGFVEEAVSVDGRGHFLSGYDGEECEVGEFFAYRIN